MIDQISLNEFADLLPNKARMERDPIFESMLERRDKSLRVTFGEAIDRWFRQYFDVDVKKSRDYVYGEGLKRLGLNPIPKGFVVLPSLRQKCILMWHRLCLMDNSRLLLNLSMATKGVK